MLTMSNQEDCAKSTRGTDGTLPEMRPTWLRTRTRRLYATRARADIVRRIWQSSGGASLAGTRAAPTLLESLRFQVHVA